MNETEKKYCIGLGVSGGIAAFKAIEVMRILQKSGCQVRVAMTRHATEFIKPLTFRALTENYVLVDDYDENNPDPIAHINFSQNIDLLLIVPATANILAKFANGIADDFLTSTYLASTAPVMVAPAMNTTMWDQPATQRNIEKLKGDGVHFAAPVEGELACKTVGTGKLEDVENIARQALELLARAAGKSGVDAASPDGNQPAETQNLLGERVLITVGGTREPIDPVRFISNHSSGRMGFAVAEAARRRGAQVTVVCGVTKIDPPENVRVIEALSAAQMFDSVMRELPDKTIFIGAAAVADYRPKNIAETKIKKEKNEVINLELEKTSDILLNVSKNRPHGLLVVGFAAETDDVVSNARSKLKSKDLDLVIANDITVRGAGFDAETNIATMISKNGRVDIELPLMSKRDMAGKILDEVVRLRKLSKAA